MRIWLVGLGLLLAAATAEAATITITTTPEQDAAIAVLKDKLNADQPKPLSDNDYRTYIMTQWMDGLVSQGNAAMVEQYKQAAEKAPASLSSVIPHHKHEEPR